MNLEEFLSQSIPVIDITYGKILLSIFVLVFGYLAVTLLVHYVRRSMDKADMSELLIEFTGRITKLLLLIVVLVAAVGALGFDVGSGLVSIAVVFGFVIGFAFQDILGNLAAGFMIALTKPFKAGEFVEAAGKTGNIKNVGISNTVLLTGDNKKVIIPNSEVWGSSITNYTTMDTRRIDLTIGIGYDDNIGKAMEVISNIVKNHEKVLKEPSPTIATNELGGSSVNLIVRPWVKTSDYWPVKRELLKQIKERFEKEEIELPYPQTDIHLFKEN
ncbi:MAG: Small-conductance mechanosensitive channel, MscC family [Candidatus Methanohalarchaeum thermophilum]|uniref:Small-conductance mechanosensitive channel, MscC family n=1 Tax=Methanohalarchaeum thermophilum TaxID=1903181 RepID=A0A1Q6DV12_METT1|nr:MAG: Small-conductance mechanosensitive channel, MscC family [Candidatus Methanohalarchaeum thermophilum]